MSSVLVALMVVLFAVFALGLVMVLSRVLKAEAVKVAAARAARGETPQGS